MARARLPATAPSTEQNRASDISQMGSAPDRPRSEMTAAGSFFELGAASAAEVSGRISTRQAGSSERNENTSTSPRPDSTRSHDTRPYLLARYWSRPTSSGVRGAKSMCPPSEGTTW